MGTQKWWWGLFIKDKTIDTVYCFLLLWMARLLWTARKEVDLHYEKFSLAPIFKVKPNLYHGLLFLQKFICILVLNFKAMFWAQVKVRKKNFCMVLAQNQQKHHDRSPLNAFSYLDYHATSLQTITHLTRFGSYDVVLLHSGLWSTVAAFKCMIDALWTSPYK